MSMVFFVKDPAGRQVYVADTDSLVDVDFAVLYVNDPGHGEVLLCGFHRGGDRAHRCDFDDKRLRGSDLGLVLERLTDLAITDSRDIGTVHRLGTLTVGEARLLLPSFQRAVVLAAAGSNRYEAVMEAPGEAPEFCVTCGEGEIYATSECRTPQHPDASCARTDWCDQYGHSWFAGRAPAAASPAMPSDSPATQTPIERVQPAGELL
jgi:hypothetical protein